MKTYALFLSNGAEWIGEASDIRSAIGLAEQANPGTVVTMGQAI